MDNQQKMLKILVFVSLLVSFTYIVLIDNIERYQREDVIAVESETDRDVQIAPALMICSVNFAS